MTQQQPAQDSWPSLSAATSETACFSIAKASDSRTSPGVSGADSIADGRAFALWDYDRDGWQDIVLVNANAPLLQLFHNDIGQRSGGDPSSGQMIAVLLVGGNRTAAPSGDFAARDGYGAIVAVTFDGLSLMREHRCGEGFSAQNSDTLIIGLGQRSVVSSLAVRWPSGITSETRDIPAGSLITVFEDVTQSPDGSGFTLESYHLRPDGAVGESMEQDVPSTGGLEFVLPHTSQLRRRPVGIGL